MTKRKYNSIDLIKLIMALCVVAIHTGPLENCTNTLAKGIYEAFVRMAVPFFFLSAGFLLGNKMEYPFIGENNVTTLKNYLTKIIKMYLIWTAIYFPMAVYHFISEGMNPIKAAFLYIRGFILIGEQYNSWPLWYLLSTIYALLLLIFLLKKKVSFKRIIIIGVIIFLISVAITYLTGYTGSLPMPVLIIQKLFKWSIREGRIFSGMFYIPLGMYFSNQRIPNWVSWLLMIFGYIANVIIADESISTLLVAISSIAFFDIVKNLSLPDSGFYKTARNMSTVIYFIHMYVWTFYYLLVYGEKTFGFDCFAVTSCICIIVAFTYVKIKESKKQMQ